MDQEDQLRLSKRTRIGLIVLVVVILSVLSYKYDTSEYWSALIRVISEIANKEPSIECELERARSLMATLIPDIQKNVEVVAREEVEVTRIRKEMEDAKRVIELDRQELLDLRARIERLDLQNPTGMPRRSLDDVRSELRRRFSRYRIAEATVKAQQQILHDREKSLAAARGLLAKMIASTEELEVEMNYLTTRLRLLESKQHPSDPRLHVHGENQQIAYCKQLVDEVRVRLELAERLVEDKTYTGDELVFTAMDQGIIEEEIDRYFQAMVKQ